MRLSALLRRLLVHSGRLVGVAAGSISLVDVRGQRYAKAAEHGASCGLGSTFPLDEGITGQVAARRRPVVLASYSDVRRGHLPDAHPARAGAVVAVPLWWRGEIVGVNVAFAGGPRAFTAPEVDRLEVLTHLAVPDIVAAGLAQAPALGPGPSGPPGPAHEEPPLTRREREVLALLSKGLSDREIAEALVLARKTVEKHVGAVLRKTGTSSRTAAVVRALEEGWLPAVGPRGTG